MKTRSGHHLKQCVSLSFFTHCNGSSCCSSACFCQVRPQDLLVSLALVSRFVPPAHPRQVGPAHVLVAGLFRVLVTRLVEPEVVAVLVVVFLHLVRLVFVLFSHPLQELLSLYELPWSCGCTIACGPSRPFSRNRWESSREVHQRSLDEVFALGHVEFGELSKLADEFSISVFDTLSLKLASRAAHCWGDFRSEDGEFLLWLYTSKSTGPCCWASCNEKVPYCEGFLGRGWWRFGVEVSRSHYFHNERIDVAKKERWSWN